MRKGSSLVSNETRKRFDAVLGIVVSLLIGGNIFFVKRLVDEIDDTNRQIMELRLDVAKIQTRLGIRKGTQDASTGVQLKNRRSTPI
jgi:hypothetical protein